uniref:BTB domain-containing protein n=1 Tax=Panagrolaimus sp. ES5 TaxID=591445 RepID=A0AC34FQT6_9BILA
MDQYTAGEPSPTILSAYMNQCNTFGRECIKFNNGSALEIVYPATTKSTTTTANEKCQGEYKIQNLSSNIKNVDIRCNCFCDVHFTRDMTFTLTDECAKYHATQITIAVDVGIEVVIPYFLRLDRTLLNHLEEGEGDSHIIQLPGYEFLTFKCTITKIEDKFELYIENIEFAVKINGSQRSYWIQLDNVSDYISDFIEKLSFSFNPDVVRQQLVEKMSDDSNSSQLFDPSNSSSSRPSAPTAAASEAAADEDDEDLQFFDATCNGCLNWECERHKGFPSERKKDTVAGGDVSNVQGDTVGEVGKVNDEKWTDKHQILDIYDKEKKQKDVSVEAKTPLVTMENLRKALAEIQMVTSLQKLAESETAAATVPSNTSPSMQDANSTINDQTQNLTTQAATNPTVFFEEADVSKNDEKSVNEANISKLRLRKSHNPYKYVSQKICLDSLTTSSSNVTSPTKKTNFMKTPIAKITKLHQSSDKDLSQLLSSLQQKQEFYNKILNQTKYTDVILVNQKGEEVYGLRCFLAHSSPVFQAVFDSKEELPVRIEVGPFERETMQQAICFSQGDLITVNGNTMDLFKFAKTYSMGILMDCCFSSLAQTISNKNICEYIKFAYEENNADLKKRCLEFLKANKLSVDPIAIKQLPQEILFDAFLS